MGTMQTEMQKVIVPTAQETEPAKAETPKAGKTVLREVKAAKPAAIAKPILLSSVTLAAFFNGTEAERIATKIAKAEQSRLNHLVAMISATGLDDIKTACREYVADVGTQYGWKGGKGAGDAPPKVKTARQRMSEVKILAGAVKLAGFKIEGEAGYHQTVTAARETLQEKRLKWDGRPMLDDAGKRVEKIAKAEGDIIAAMLEATEAKARELGRHLTADERAEVFKQAEKLHKAAIIKHLAEKLVADHGPAVAVAVAQMVLDLNK